MRTPTILLPTGQPQLTPDLFQKIAKMNPLQGLKCVPHTIMSLYRDPEAWALLKTMEFVVYMGAPLDRVVGDELSQSTHLTPMIGTTEGGDQLSLRPVDKKLWYTHQYLPENGHTMVPLVSNEAEGDLHELVFTQPKERTPMYFQMCFWNPAHRDLDKVETNELYRSVKDLDGKTRWEFSGRKDDLTKLNWLAKFNAQDIETTISRHDDVEHVVVGGQGRPSPYVIIQVKEGVLEHKTERQIIDGIYADVIVAVNKVDIEEVHIPKGLVLLAQKDKPFKVNLKGAVVRRVVEADYCEEVEMAYSSYGKA